MENRNPFLLQIAETDQALYNALYKFNPEAELQDYELGLGQKNEKGKEKEMEKIEKSRLSEEKSKKQKQIEIIQQQEKDEMEEQKIKEDEEENGMEEQKSESKNINYQEIIASLFKEEKTQKKENKIQNARYIDKAVWAQLQEIKTGEEAISFFAKYGNTTPIKFIYCVSACDKDAVEYRPYDLKVIKMSKHQQQPNLPEYYTISAQGIVHVYDKSKIKQKRNKMQQEQMIEGIKEKEINGNQKERKQIEEEEESTEVFTLSD